MTRRTTERLLGAVALLAAAALLVLGLVVAPTDAVQGAPQRLLYVHVPAAWVAYVAFAGVLWCSVAYLLRRDLVWDRRAQAATEIGVGLTALTIALGALWGRPIWGVWWTWDARLTSTTVLLLVYVGCLGVRGLAEDAHLGARRAGVVGVVGFANIPVVHFSVVWWRTLHQPPTVLQPSGPSVIEPEMLVALLVGLVAFTLGAVWLWLRRVRLLHLEAEERAPALHTDGPVPEVVVASPRPEEVH